MLVININFLRLTLKLFWEDLKNPSYTYNLTILSNIKKEWKIGQTFVAFLEYLNFKKDDKPKYSR